MLTLRWTSLPGLALMLGLTSAQAEERVSAERELVLDDDQYELKLSLPTEEDVAAWRQPGFRIALGVGYGVMRGLRPAGHLSTFVFAVRHSMRLDERWSLAANIQFAGGSGEYAGLRWVASLGPVFHPWRSLALSLSLGYGGNSLSTTGSPGWKPEPRTDYEVTQSHTVPNNQALSSCTGGAWTSMARAEYLMVVGPIFSTGPFAQAEAQVTRCVESGWIPNNETGRQVEARQWWTQLGGSVGWWFSWR